MFPVQEEEKSTEEEKNNNNNSSSLSLSKKEIKEVVVVGISSSSSSSKALASTSTGDTAHKERARRLMDSGRLDPYQARLVATVLTQGCRPTPDQIAKLLEYERFVAELERYEERQREASQEPREAPRLSLAAAQGYWSTSAMRERLAAYERVLEESECSALRAKADELRRRLGCRS